MPRGGQSDDARDYLVALDGKSRRIVEDNLHELEDDPYPRPHSGRGDKEQLVVDGEELYRLHVGRTHTAFYDGPRVSSKTRSTRTGSLESVSRATTTGPMFLGSALFGLW